MNKGALLPFICLCLVALTPVSPGLAAGDTAPVAIAIHAGAGTIKAEEIPPEHEREIRSTLRNAVVEGHRVLEAGGSSLDAVTRAVTLLEDSPFFNAGRGAVFNAEGKNELDASIMDGASLDAGAVAGVRNVRNPVLLARKIMTDSKHVMLMGEGAAEFAREHGITFEDDDYFHTDYRWQQLQKTRESQQAGTSRAPSEPDRWLSTVGAVAVDAKGNLAAATSTGGMTGKRWGRVGDSPIIGAGTYADNRSCAVSATGHGEYFIRATVARDICARVQFTGVSLQQAADKVINDILVEMGGDGGIIAIDAQGNIALTFNTAGMYRASVDSRGDIYVAIYDED